MTTPRSFVPAQPGEAANPAGVPPPGAFFTPSGTVTVPRMQPILPNRGTDGGATTPPPGGAGRVFPPGGTERPTVPPLPTQETGGIPASLPPTGVPPVGISQPSS
jgi:hypothetical protein